MNKLFSFTSVSTAVAAIVSCVGLLFGIMQYPGADICIIVSAVLMIMTLALWMILALRQFKDAKGLVIYSAFTWLAIVVTIALHLLHITAANPLLLLTLSVIAPIDIILLTIHSLRKQQSAKSGVHTNDNKIHISK